MVRVVFAGPRREKHRQNTAVGTEGGSLKQFICRNSKIGKKTEEQRALAHTQITAANNSLHRLDIVCFL